MKRRLCIASLLMLLLPMLLAIPVSANSPVPPAYYTVVLSNQPDTACYVDLLVPLSPEDETYAENIMYLVDDLTNESSIYLYNEDGFMSYTFHYRDAVSKMALEYNCASFFENTKDNLNLFKEVKIAVVDAKGEILQISKAFAPWRAAFTESILGIARYDYVNNSVELDVYNTSPYLLIFAIINVLGIALTVGVEYFIAHCFRMILDYRKVVIITNLISQILMRVLFYVLYVLVIQSYLVCLIVLEILVYVAEYRVYQYKMPEVPGETLKLYVCIANTASLMLGIGVNLLLIR